MATRERWTFRQMSKSDSPGKREVGATEADCNREAQTARARARRRRRQGEGEGQRRAVCSRHRANLPE